MTLRGKACIAGAFEHPNPATRGGLTKVIEAVRQLRGDAQPAVQVFPPAR